VLVLSAYFSRTVPSWAWSPSKEEHWELQVQDFLKARSPSICHWRNSVKALKRLHNNTLSPVRSEGEEEEEEDFA